MVKIQLICAAGRTFAGKTVSTFPTSPPKLAGLSVKAALASVQVAEVVV